LRCSPSRPFSSLDITVVLTDVTVLLQSGTAAELLVGMQAACGDDVGVARGLFADMVLPCCHALSVANAASHVSDDVSASASIVALSSLAAKCMLLASDQLSSLAAIYASLALDTSFCELPAQANALIVTSCLASLRPDAHGSLPVLNICILLANSGMLVGPAGMSSMCAGAAAALGSLVNKCDSSLALPAASAAFDVLLHRVCTQSRPEHAAHSLAWIVR
jgi:hypothetical protein